MFLKDAPHAERPTAMPELLQDYKAQRVRLIAQTRELERLRQQVRSSAEREAAAIVTAARQNVRRVLLDARHELLVLVAQLQAVGCDTRPADLPQNVFPTEATSSSTIISAVETSAPGALPPGHSITGARRDVREVLLEAQSELVALAEEARELRARIATQHSHAQELPAAAESIAATAPQESESAPASTPVPEPAPASFSHAEADVAAIGYTPLASTPRVFVAIAAGIVVAAVGVVLFLSSSGRAASPRAPQSLRPEPSQASSEPTTRPQPVAAAVPLPSAPRDSSVLSLTIDVKRPAWIRTTVDGRADLGRLFDAGEKRTVTAREAIVMRAGDAGAVFVSVNGGQARPLGLDGHVISRRFGNPAAPSQPKPGVLQTTARSESTSSEPAPESERGASDVGTTGKADTVAAPPVPVVEREILRATQQWFEAYFAGNAEAMRTIATPDFAMVDERGDGQRLPATTRAVDRGLQQVRIEVAGDAAVISARLTERANVNGQLREYVSLVSGVWVRADGSWRLMGVRFMDPAKIGA
jgi:cell division septum initiation protein DivIVA